MNEFEKVKNYIEKVWVSPLGDELKSHKIDTSIYSELGGQVPDKYLVIEEVFPQDEIDDIWDNFKPHLSEHEIFPFVETLGEGVICVGYGQSNKGKIYYFDFDFGHFLLDDSFDEFTNKLIKD